uniref:Cytochrome P450 n=1 Tax=Trichogramma kaykai TaxID=54128 RepID=A0ABD2VXW0_9HYME
MIKSVTIKNFDRFCDREAFLDPEVDPLFAGNLFSIRGDKWREASNLLSPAFTASKMRLMFAAMRDCCEACVDHVARLPERERLKIDTKDVFTRLTNDTIARCSFGLKVDSLKEPDNQFYVLGRKGTDSNKFSSAKFALGSFFPGLMKLVEDDVGDFFKNLIADTIRNREEQGVRCPDMLQLMMDALGKDRRSHLELDITEMTAHAFLFFFGGFDTTSTQMCVTAHELAVNLDAQRKLREAIDAASQPTYEVINSMPYLDAVLKESLLKHTQFNFLNRICTKSFELPPTLPGAKPLIVQPDTNVWIPATAIHRDPSYFENPDRFDPDRFLGKTATTTTTSDNDYAVNLGFGIGPRGCIGQRFATMEIKMLFFVLLSRFELRPNEKTPQPYVYSTKSITLLPEGGFSLSMIPRQLN